MEVSYKTIGQNIRRARLKIGLTQEKASQQLGVSTMHWGRIERGERPIKLDRLCAIANVLHVKLSTLLSGCVLDDDFDESAEIEDIVFGQMMIQIAKKCSPKTRNLMLKICRNIAEAEKRSSDLLFPDLRRYSAQLDSEGGWIYPCIFPESETAPVFRRSHPA